MVASRAVTDCALELYCMMALESCASSGGREWPLNWGWRSVSMTNMHEQPHARSPLTGVQLSDDVRKLAQRIKETYDSEEFQAFWQPAKKTISQSNKIEIRAWAEDRIGHKPDSVLKVHLSAKELGDATPRETWELVDGRGEKLASKAQSEGVHCRDSGPLGSGLCRILDTDFREHPFPDVGWAKPAATKPPCRNQRTSSTNDTS